MTSEAMTDVATLGNKSLSLSVAMCTFNGARYLEEQLATISAQTRPPDEIVICDDCSSDATVDQLHAFARKASHTVRIVQNAKNLGYSRNFVQAINLCTGDIIVLSDQDDRWHDTRLQRMEDLFLQHGTASGIFTNGCLMDQDSRTLPGTLWSSFQFGKEDQQRLGKGEAVQVLLKRNVVTGMALAIRRDACELLQSLPPHWPHDFWLALMLAAHGQLCACPETLVTYRVHAHQQIGVPIARQDKIDLLLKHGLRAYIELSRQRNIHEYTREAVQYEALLSTAKENAKLQSAWWLPMARAKAEHARSGLALPNLSNFSRARHVLKNWKAYQHYSPTGSSAFWRDLLF